jgi:hypothetical protein
MQGTQGACTHLNRETGPMTKAIGRAVQSGMQAIRRVRAPATYEIHGERFFCSREGPWLYLEHPSWSLMGRGHTIQEARANLVSEAKELADVMSDMAEDTLAPEAIRMRDFASKVALAC